MESLLKERYSEKYGLISGATTFDWGDAQVEGGAVVDVDLLTHWSIDIYDNAMLVIALKDMENFAQNDSEKKRWKDLGLQVSGNIKKLTISRKYVL